MMPLFTVRLENRFHKISEDPSKVEGIKKPNVLTGYNG